MPGWDFQVAVFWLSYLVFPWFVLAIWQILRRPADRVRQIVWGILLFGSLLFFYARFIEPGFLVVKPEVLAGRTEGVTVRMAIASDFHIGVFQDESLVQRVVDQIKKEKPDLLLIPGDFINNPTPEQLRDSFKPLSQLNIPIYAVTGNHDAGVPGNYSSEQVRQALQGLVRTDDNKVDYFEKDGRTMAIYGLSDLMEGDYDFRILKGMPADRFNLLLTHNPDTAYDLPANLPISLIVAGHTHGGQIFMPPFSNWMIPTVHPFVRGWYKVGGVPVYVTSGLGEVLLPLRFLMPPELVMMEVKI